VDEKENYMTVCISTAPEEACKTTAEGGKQQWPKCSNDFHRSSNGFRSCTAPPDASFHLLPATEIRPTCPSARLTKEV
jgi:hypothetical protein